MSRAIVPTWHMILTDGATGRLSLVTAEIVEDDDIALRERRDEHLLALPDAQLTKTEHGARDTTNQEFVSEARQESLAQMWCSRSHSDRKSKTGAQSGCMSLPLRTNVSVTLRGIEAMLKLARSVVLKSASDFRPYGVGW